MDSPEASNPYAATVIEESPRPRFSLMRGLVAMGGGALVGLAMGLVSAPLPEENKITVTFMWLFSFSAFAAYAPPSPHRLLRATGVVGLIGIANLMLIGGLAEALFDLPTDLRSRGQVRQRVFECAGVTSSACIVFWTFYVGRRRGTEVAE